MQQKETSLSWKRMPKQEEKDKVVLCGSLNSGIKGREHTWKEITIVYVLV